MLNSVTIAGNLGQDPEMRYTQDGLAIATLNIAVNEFRRSPDGEPTKVTHWFRAVAFGRTAEVAAEYLHKGSKVALQGALVQRTWQDQHGNNRSAVEIRINQLEFMMTESLYNGGDRVDTAATSGGASRQQAGPSPGYAQPRTPSQNASGRTGNRPMPAIPSQDHAAPPDDDIPF